MQKIMNTKELKAALEDEKESKPICAIVKANNGKWWPMVISIESDDYRILITLSNEFLHTLPDIMEAQKTPKRFALIYILSAAWDWLKGKLK